MVSLPLPTTSYCKETPFTRTFGIMNGIVIICECICAKRKVLTLKQKKNRLAFKIGHKKQTESFYICRKNYLTFNLFMTASISKERLRQLSNAKSFEKGEAYFRHKAVKSVVKNGNTYKGKVEGSELYQISIELKAYDITAYCNCPYSFGGALQTLYCRRFGHHCRGLLRSFVRFGRAHCLPSSSRQVCQQHCSQ